MSTKEKNGFVLVEYVLGSVAMMHVPINDENFTYAVFFLGVTSCDGDVVEETEAHALIGCGVMSRWSDDAEGIGGFACKNFVHRGEGCACCEATNVERGGANGGVTCTELGLSGFDVGFDGVEVFPGVATQDVGVFAGSWVHFAELVGDAGVVERLEDSFVAVGLFGMAESGDVFFEGDVGDKDGVRRCDLHGVFHGREKILTLPAFLCLGYEVVKGLEKGVRIIRPGSSLGMVLDGKNRKILMAEA